MLYLIWRGWHKKVTRVCLEKIFLYSYFWKYIYFKGGGNGNYLFLIHSTRLISELWVIMVISEIFTGFDVEGTCTILKPSFLASSRRFSNWVTGFMIPVRDISPRKSAWSRCFFWSDDKRAATIARSTAGSPTDNPCDTLIYTSSASILIRQNLAIVAKSKSIFWLEIPLEDLLGYGNRVECVSASISKIIGRFHSIDIVRADPVWACDLMIFSPGFLRSVKPYSPISNNHRASVGPNRFFNALNILYDWYLSPSKNNTVSTRCSRVLGPARSQSLVTCHMRMTAVLCFSQNA